MKSCLMLCLTLCLFLSTARASDGHVSLGAPSSQEQNSCHPRVLSNYDKLNIEEFDKDLARLEGLKSNPTSYEKTVERLITRYDSKLSPAAKQVLVAKALEGRVTATSNELKTNKDISGALVEWQQSLDEIRKGSRRYKDASGWSRITGKADKEFKNLRNNESAALIKLMSAIRGSSLSPSTQRSIIGRFISFSTELNRSTVHSIDQVINKYERRRAVAKGVRDVSIASGLIVSAILTGGATVAAGTAVAGASGSAATGLIASSIVAGATGAAGGAGYGLLRGTASNVGNALMSDGDFLCSLAREQIANSDQTYKDALTFAAYGGGIGAAFGLGLGAGGAWATTTLGIGTTATVVGTGTSAWGTGQHAVAAKKYYDESVLAAENGDEVKARELLALSRREAVEAGLSSVDTVLAGVGAHRSFKGFKSALNATPKSISEHAKIQQQAILTAEISNDPRIYLRNSSQTPKGGQVVFVDYKGKKIPVKLVGGRSDSVRYILPDGRTVVGSPRWISRSPASGISAEEAILAAEANQAKGFAGFTKIREMAARLSGQDSLPKNATSEESFWVRGKREAYDFAIQAALKKRLDLSDPATKVFLYNYAKEYLKNGPKRWRERISQME